MVSVPGKTAEKGRSWRETGRYLPVQARDHPLATSVSASDIPTSSKLSDIRAASTKLTARIALQSLNQTDSTWLIRKVGAIFCNMPVVLWRDLSGLCHSPGLKLRPASEPVLSARECSCCRSDFQSITPRIRRPLTYIRSRCAAYTQRLHYRLSAGRSAPYPSHNRVAPAAPSPCIATPCIGKPM